MKTRSVSVVLSGMAMFIAGCVGVGNDKIATYYKVGDRYVIEVTGARAGMAHEVGQLVNRPTSTQNWQFDVPRVDGTIDGREIRQKPGFYPYVGTITIRGRNMEVKLSGDNYEFHRLDPVSWNGTYTLVEKTKEPNQSVEPTPGSVTPRAP